MRISFFVIFFFILFMFGCGEKKVEKTLISKKSNTVSTQNSSLEKNEDKKTQEEEPVDIEAKVNEIIKDSKAEVYNANDYIQDDDSVIIAKVGESNITLQDYNDELNNYPEDIKARISPKTLLSRMIDTDVILNEIKKEKFYDNSKYKDNLAAVKRAVIAKEYSDSRYNSIFSKLKISEGNIEKYYNEHKNDFNIPNQYHVFQILISGNSKESEEKALKIRNMVNKNNFENIAKKYSDDDATKENGGDMGFFTADSLFKELSDFVVKAKPGLISDPIKSRIGYHILMVSEIRKNHDKSLNDVKDDIESILKRGKASQRFELWKKQSFKDIHEKIFKSVFDKKNISDSEIIAEVGNKKITYKELENQINNLPSIVHNAYKRKDEKIRLVKKMIEDEKLYQLAIKNKFDKSEEMEPKLATLERNVLVKSYIDEKIRKNVIENKEFRQKFLKRLSHQIRVYHIFIKASDNSSDIEKKKALNKIKEIASKVKNEEDFKKYASKYNDDATKERNGDLGMVRYGQMVPEFEKVAFSLKKGEISKVVKTRFGYHLIMVTDIKDIKIPEGDKSYNNAMIQSFYSRWMKNLRKKYTILRFEDRLPKKNG